MIRGQSRANTRSTTEFISTYQQRSKACKLRKLARPFYGPYRIEAATPRNIRAVPVDRRKHRANRPTTDEQHTDTTTATNRGGMRAN